MPNWCHNRILIEGSTESLTILRTRLIANVHSLALTSDGHRNQWDIISDWDDPIEIESTTAGGLSIFIETRWKPPIDWAGALLQEFPDLHVEIGYCEQGVELYGVWMDGIDDPHKFETTDVPMYDDSEDEYLERTVDTSMGALRAHLEKYRIGLGG